MSQQRPFGDSELWQRWVWTSLQWLMDCCQTPGRSVRQGAVNPSLMLKCMVCHWGGLGPSVCGAISTEAAERKSRPPEASSLTLLCLATRSLSPSLPVHLCYGSQMESRRPNAPQSGSIWAHMSASSAAN